MEQDLSGSSLKQFDERLAAFPVAISMTESMGSSKIYSSSASSLL